MSWSLGSSGLFWPITYHFPTTDEIYDLIGIGALNLDLIVSIKRLQQYGDSKLVSNLVEKFIKEQEKKISPEDTAQIMSNLDDRTFDPSLGGSAFNAVLTIASMHLGLRLGYIGVAGKIDTGNAKGSKLDFREKLDAEHVDIHLVDK